MILNLILTISIICIVYSWVAWLSFKDEAFIFPAFPFKVIALLILFSEVHIAVAIIFAVIFSIAWAIRASVNLLSWLSD